MIIEVSKLFYTKKLFITVPFSSSKALIETSVETGCWGVTLVRTGFRSSIPSIISLGFSWLQTYINLKSTNNIRTRFPDCYHRTRSMLAQSLVGNSLYENVSWPSRFVCSLIALFQNSFLYMFAVDCIILILPFMVWLHCFNYFFHWKETPNFRLRGVLIILRLKHHIIYGLNMSPYF